MKFTVIFGLTSVLALMPLGCAPSASTGADSVTGTSSPGSVHNTTQAVLKINGMGCPLCANNVDQQLMKLPGVTGVDINLGTGVVIATLNPDNPPTEEALRKAIDGTGFTLVEIAFH